MGFVTVLSSSVRGDLERRQAPTRIPAGEGLLVDVGGRRKIVPSNFAKLFLRAPNRPQHSLVHRQQFGHNLGAFARSAPAADARWASSDFGCGLPPTLLRRGELGP